MDYNAFINKHKTRICIFLQFPDYKSGLIDLKTGKILPTPNQTTKALLKKKKFSGDVVLKTVAGSKGKVQHIFISDIADAKNIAPNLSFQNGNGAPCTSSASRTIDGNEHARIAKALGIF